MRDVDFGWEYPPGVTAADIDRQFADWQDEQVIEAVERWIAAEQVIEAVERWIAADPAWWRRYVSATDWERRRRLIDARVAVDGGPDDRPTDMLDHLDYERDSVVSRARRNARMGVLVARHVARAA